MSAGADRPERSVEGPMTYVYLDCETTGLDPTRHEVWEIAYAVDDGPIQSSFVPHRAPTIDASVRAALRVNGYLDRWRHVSPDDSDNFETELREVLDGATLVELGRIRSSLHGNYVRRADA